MHFSTSLPHMHALLEGFLQDPLQLHHHDLCDTVHVFKMSPLDDPHELGEEEKSTQSQVRWVGSTAMFLARCCGCSGHCDQVRCHGETAMNCPDTTASSRARNEVNVAVSLRVFATGTDDQPAWLQGDTAAFTSYSAWEEARVVTGQLNTASPCQCTCSQCPHHLTVPGQENHCAGTTSLLTRPGSVCFFPFLQAQLVIKGPVLKM